MSEDCIHCQISELLERRANKTDGLINATEVVSGLAQVAGELLACSDDLEEQFNLLAQMLAALTSSMQHSSQNVDFKLAMKTIATALMLAPASFDLPISNSERNKITSVIAMEAAALAMLGFGFDSKTNFLKLAEAAFDKVIVLADQVPDRRG